MIPLPLLSRCSSVLPSRWILYVAMWLQKKKKKSYIALFSQLHSHPVCFSHLNPLWAGGRLAAGAGLLWMLTYMLNKADTHFSHHQPLYIPSPSSSSIFHSAIHGWPRLLEVMKIIIIIKKKTSAESKSLLDAVANWPFVTPLAWKLPIPPLPDGSIKQRTPLC